jgi:hypothetical protein
VPELPQPADLHRRNRLLAALPPEAFAFLVERLTLAEVATGEMIYEEDQTITHAVFPHDCTLSVVAVMADGRSAEAGSIGNEGCFGIASGFADRRAPRIDASSRSRARLRSCRSSGLTRQWRSRWSSGTS